MNSQIPPKADSGSQSFDSPEVSCSKELLYTRAELAKVQYEQPILKFEGYICDHATSLSIEIRLKSKINRLEADERHGACRPSSQYEPKKDSR